MSNFKKAGLIVFGVFVVVLAIYAFSPLLYDKEVNESVGEISGKPAQETMMLPESETVNSIETLKQGEFVGVAGHDAKGSAKILKSGNKYFIRLEDDFEATNGPDLYVYLGNDGRYDPAAEVSRLKGNVGGQNYEIPESLNANQYNGVWIWCKAFSVEFGKAVLNSL